MGFEEREEDVIHVELDENFLEDEEEDTKDPYVDEEYEDELYEENYYPGYDEDDYQHPDGEYEE